jgi:hypothetical protein
MVSLFILLPVFAIFEGINIAASFKIVDGFIKGSLHLPNELAFLTKNITTSNQAANLGAFLSTLPLTFFILIVIFFRLA